MPTPITSNSPALAAMVIEHGASSSYVQKIISVVNASPYLNQLLNDFEARTLPDGTKPHIFTTGTSGPREDPGPALKNTDATDRRITISDDDFVQHSNEGDQRAWELNLTKDLAHELQHANSWATRRVAEAAPKPCAARCRRSPRRAARNRKNYAFDSEQRPFDAGYGAKRS